MFAVTDGFNHCVTARSRSENLLRLVILGIVSLSGVFWMQGIGLARNRAALLRLYLALVQVFQTGLRLHLLQAYIAIELAIPKLQLAR